MSVIKAILFYSKRDKKSFRMKTIIDNIGADIETVSVDSSIVRDRLQEDDKYGIDQVPTILLLYSSGQHKTYTNKNLDDWFNQLLTNIQEYNSTQSQPMYTEIENTPIDIEPVYSSIDDNIPKALRRKPSQVSNIPQSLPSPGRDIDSGMSSGISGAHAAMISEHIVGSGPTVSITSDPFVQPARKEVKKDTVSAAELAKQMAEQREVYEDRLEENRPFM